MSEFSEIYKLYFDDVFKYVLTLSKNELIAEEITQETFFKALKNIDKFNGSCKLYVWLCQIAKNTYFTMYKKQSNNKNLVDHKESNDLEKELINKEKAFDIHRILHHMQEPHKEVFTLRTFGELPFNKIGQLFGKTDSWARVTYHRAKLKIQEELNKE
ncbi:MAG: sigma-70 family RNA polymerase sigma factor [Peptostreptococcaceae bacterium]|jgi:RNA polymerase sigma-70 factor (ECF subfamily)|nr:sigma-70 family RNA polymerase sigma factor [Peptostreptococcaceae bacterium]